jgi:type II pantothenate kinase
MGRTIGVDVGATLCKIVPLDAPHAAVHCPSDAMSEVQAQVLAHRPTQVGATGGGARRLAAALSHLPVVTVGEFDAWAAGAPLLAGADGITLPPRYLLASLGTGTSIIAVGEGPPIRVGGTAVGGGTFMGLGRLLLAESSFEALAALAASGDRRRVDLLVSDVYREIAAPLGGDLTAANFGKLQSVARADVAAALANLVGETVALVAGALARGAGIDTIVYCGSTLLGNPALTSVLEDITRRFGSTPHFLRGGAQCGALGAAALAASRAAS